MKTFALALILLLPGAAAGAENVKGNAFGSSTAPITMEVYSDFQCPACKRLHDEELPMLMRDYVMPGKVYLVYRYFPLPMHTYGRLSADLVCAAAQFGKYEPAANILFATQASWSKDGKAREAVESILTPAERSKLNSLLKAPVVQSQVDGDLAIGRTVPVQSTPTLVLTHRMKRYPLSGQGALNYNLVRVLLDDLLSKK